MKLCYDETGTENGDTIVFLHAAGLSGWMWNEQVKYFDNYHCIIPDLPEHGFSANVKPFTIQMAAEKVGELIGECTDGTVNLVGIGLGGQIILQIMSKYPDLVHSALVSGTLVRNKNYISLISRLNQLLKIYVPGKNNNFYIKAYMRTYNMPKAYYEEFKRSTCQIESGAIERVLIENHRFKMPDINILPSKLLVMAGEKDYSIIKDSSRDIIKNYGVNGALALGTGHLWNMETPNNFNKVLESWIQNDPLPKGIISKL